MFDYNNIGTRITVDGLSYISNPHSRIFFVNNTILTTAAYAVSQCVPTHVTFLIQTWPHYMRRTCYLISWTTSCNKLQQPKILSYSPIANTHKLTTPISRLTTLRFQLLENRPTDFYYSANQQCTILFHASPYFRSTTNFMPWFQSTTTLIHYLSWGWILTFFKTTLAKHC